MTEPTDDQREPADGQREPADELRATSPEPMDDGAEREAADDGHSAGPGAGRAPTAAAQAASRARRIGGRPVAGPRADDVPAEAPVPRRRPSPHPRPAEQADEPRRPRAVPGRLRPRGATSPRQPLDPETFHRRVAQAGTALLVVGALAVAALLGVGLWLSHGVWWAKPSPDARRNAVRAEVLAAAKTCTAALLSFDYRSLDVSEKAGKDCSTGQLNKDYVTLMEQTVKKIAPQTKTVQQFQTIKAGVTSVSPDGKQWVVLVYGQTSVNNTSTAGGSTATPSASPSGSRSPSSTASSTAPTSTAATASPSGSPSGSAGSTPSAPGRLDISTASVTLSLVDGHWLLSNMTTTS